jgi:hypothetical protein
MQYYSSDGYQLPTVLPNPGRNTAVVYLGKEMGGTLDVKA